MNRSAGFTLIELIVTIAIAAIVLVMGVPSFQDTIRNNRLATQANELISALNLARSEAIKRGVTVSICKSANGSTCGGSGWSNGWIVFVNRDNDSPAQVDAGEEILRVYGPVPTNYSLNANNNFTNYISYRPTDRSNNIGRFVLCEGGQLNYSRAIFINITGRPRLGQDNNHNNIPEDDSGNDITSCTP